MLKNIKKNITAQTILEYTLIMGIIGAVMFAMTPLFKRGVQGMIKTVADEIGFQKNAEQKYNKIEGGYMEAQYTRASASGATLTQDVVGTIQYTYDDRTRTSTLTNMSLGFMEKVPR